MLDWQKRVIKEREELANRSDKLDAFLETEDFSNLIPAASALLIAQTFAMKMYAEVLDMRIELFEN